VGHAAVPQVPLLQVTTVQFPALGQTWPQAPQLAVSLLTSIQVPPQFAVPDEQHLPFEHDVPVGQTVGQVPQCCSSVLRLTQTPPQLVVPVRQHLPFEQ
jgi:hypothetical protein